VRRTLPEEEPGNS